VIHRTASFRKGAVMVETAIVVPVMLFLLLAIIIGGLGVFHYQQTAMLACGAARYASVRGGQWETATGQKSPTQTQILDNAVLPQAVGMNSKNITISVQLIDGVTGKAKAWNSSNKGAYSLTATNEPVSNHVRVTLTYAWNPGVMWTGTLTLSSVCEMPMSF
jgi:Flp pilus assembly protein TadG